MVDTSHHYLELSQLPAPLAWPAFFGNDQPVELEVGSGKGLFLANAGAAMPGCNFVGVELSRKYARLAAERVAKRGLPNVRVVQGDARLLLAHSVKPGSLRVMHVYFPDPWWKKRHKKRRVFTATFVDDAERALQPGGEIWIATDVAEYFDVMRRLVAGHLAFTDLPIPPPGTPEHDLDYLTSFERKYRLAGRPILRAHYRLGGAGTCGV